MGNKQSGTAARSSPRPEKPRSEPAKPTYCGWDLEDVNAMIRAGKLAKLRKKCDSDVEAFECPLCFEFYPDLNITQCCTTCICTECYLQVASPSKAKRECASCRAPAPQVSVCTTPAEYTDAYDPEAESRLRALSDEMESVGSSVSPGTSPAASSILRVASASERRREHTEAARASSQASGDARSRPGTAAPGSTPSAAAPWDSEAAMIEEAIRRSLEGSEQAQGEDRAECHRPDEQSAAAEPRSEVTAA